MEWRRAFFAFLPLLVDFRTPWAEQDLDADAILCGAEICEGTDDFSVLQLAQPELLEITSEPDPIPKIVHHIYKSDISHGPWPNPVWKQSLKAWKSLFPAPEFTHMFWNDVKVTSFFHRNCPEHLKAFAGDGRDIVRSDLSRYCILWKLGGIYADLDYQPLQNFYSDLEPGKVNLVQSPYISESFQNSLMASPPHHMYWEKLMRLAQFTIHRESVLFAAGTQLLEILPLTQNPSIVHPLPCDGFQRTTQSSDKPIGKHCKLLQLEDVKDNSLKGIHWGTASYHEQGGGSALPADIEAAFADVNLKDRP